MIGQTFPDVIIFPDGRVRLVTYGARSWAWGMSNLGMQKWYSVEKIPRMLFSVPHNTLFKMQKDGLVVWWPKTGPWAYQERIPEWRKKWPKWDGE